VNLVNVNDNDDETNLKISIEKPKVALHNLFIGLHKIYLKPGKNLVLSKSFVIFTNSKQAVGNFDDCDELENYNYSNNIKF